MMRRVFLDIDTQYDFMDPQGKLYVPGAETIEPNLEVLTRFALSRSIPLISTLDTHVPNDPEFAVFPPHCVRGTPGFEKIPCTRVEGMQLVHYEDNPLVLDLGLDRPGFMKPGYSAFTNPLFEHYIERFGGAEFIVYGVATDYCVKASSLELVRIGFAVSIVDDAIRPVAEEGGRAALGELGLAGVRFIKTEEAVR